MINGRNVINGSYGSLYHEGEFLSNIQSFEASVEFQKEELNLAGRKWTTYKVMGCSGSGSLSGFKINSKWVELIGQACAENGKTYYTELIGKLEDPDLDGRVYRVRLKNVSFNSLPLLNFEANSVVQQELEFNFEGYEILDTF